MQEFKIHVARYADDDGDFTTFCGIESGKASEQFTDDAQLVDKSDYSKATCKTCVKAANAFNKRFIELIQKIEAEYANQANE